MKILSRYVLREFLVPLFYCLTGFTSIYVLFELFGSFSRILAQHLPLGMIVRYFAGYLAPYFHYLVPAALMLATLYTMWSFCRHSEIIAMRASGVSFIAIVKSLLLVSVLMALLVVYVNEVFVPENAQWAAQMKSERFNLEKIVQADNIVYRNSSENRTWNIDEMISANGTLLRNVKVTMDRPDGTRSTTVIAERAEYLDGEWWFLKPTVQHYDALGMETASSTPEMDALTLRCFDGFGEKPSDFMMQNRPWKFNSVHDRFRYLRTHPELTADRRNELKYDTWAQIMSPWACIIITLFAIPAGIASGRQSVFKGILGALGMYFAFYALTIGCMITAKSGWINAIVGAVAPAVIFLILGIRAFIHQR